MAREVLLEVIFSLQGFWKYNIFFRNNKMVKEVLLKHFLIERNPKKIKWKTLPRT